VLANTRTHGGTFVLSMLFGVTAFVVSLFLRFGRRHLLKVLKSLDGVKVPCNVLDQVTFRLVFTMDRHMITMSLTFLHLLQVV
jgi:hypothetical protein